MVRRLVQFTVRKLWLLIAIFLVFAAVILSAVRYSLPYLDHYRTDIEQWVEESYGQRIEIGALSADWSTFGPSLVLEDVTLTVEQEQTFTLHVGRTHLVVNLWQSLYNWQWQLEDFVLDGVNADYVVELGSTGTSQLPIIDALEQLLLRQLEQFQVVNSQLNMRNQQGAGRTLYIEQLSWTNRPEKRQAHGRMRVSDVTADSLNFILDVEGARFIDMRGELYLEADELDMSPWLEAVITDVDITRAELNVRAWFDFNQGRLGNGQVHFGQNILEWARGGQQHQMRSSPVTWGIWPQRDGWQMTSEPLVLTVDDSDWPVESVQWHYVQGEHLWNLHNLEFRDTAPLWSLLGSPGAQVREWFAGIQPAGVINDIHVRLDDSLEWTFHASADDISWQAYQGVPGLDGLSFRLWSNLEFGRFELTGEQVDLVAPATFSGAQQLSKINWRGYWESLSDGWRVALPEARMEVADVVFEQRFSLTRHGSDSPQLDWWLTGDGAELAVTDALELLPLQLGPQLTDYLRQAVVDGEVDSMSLLWRGPLESFPHYQYDGIFLARLHASPLDFRFQPSWPAIENTAMTLEFRDQGLRILAQGGMLDGVEIEHVDARVPDIILPQRWLHISAEARGSANQAHDVFMKSPLADTVGATLQRLRSSEPVDGYLNLQIPLFAAAQDQQENPRVRVTGHVDFSGQGLYIEPVDLQVADLQGALQFDGATLSTDNLKAAVYGLPLDVSIAGTSTGNQTEAESSNSEVAQSTESGYELNVAMTGAWPLHQVLTVAGLDWYESESGALHTDADLRLAFQEGGFNYQWSQSNTLREAALSLPAPLATLTDASLDLNIEGDQDSMRIFSLWPGVARFEASRHAGQHAFQSALLELGATPQRGPALGEQGLAVYLDSDEVDLTGWWQLYREVQAHASVGGADSHRTGWQLPPLQTLYAEAEQVKAWSQQFNNVQLSGERVASGVQFDFISDAGRVGLSAANEGTMRIHADYFALRKLSSEFAGGGSEAQTPLGAEFFARLPAFEFTCDLCRYDDKELGRIRTVHNPDVQGKQLEVLNIRRTGAELNITGGWADTEQGYRSNFDGWLAISDVGNLLADFGVSSVVRDSNAQVEFDLAWLGSPTQFNTESLQGDVTWRLGSGYLRDVSDGGARLFSLFSLESLIRKLTLDFRDVFARGMFYSNFQGSMRIDDGIVYTDNTRMNGSAGDMEVVGTTNLQTEALNYELVYVPKVTSSLPVLVAWMVNPPTGIAALVIDRVLHQAQVISRLEYSITGTMSEPIVNEEARDQVEVEIPEIEFEQPLPEPQATDQPTETKHEPD